MINLNGISLHFDMDEEGQYTIFTQASEYIRVWNLYSDLAEIYCAEQRTERALRYGHFCDDCGQELGEEEEACSLHPNASVSTIQVPKGF